MGSRVFADANVLYSAALRDILIGLDLADVIRLHWSSAVLTELQRALSRSRGVPPEAFDKMIAAMDATLPNARTLDDVERFVCDLPDPDDLHVVHAAVAGGCDAILTFNLRDFPAHALEVLDCEISAVHPDAFLVDLLMKRPGDVLPVIEDIRKSLNNPARSVEQYIDGLVRQGLGQTGEMLRHLLPR